MHLEINMMTWSEILYKHRRVRTPRQWIATSPLDVATFLSAVQQGDRVVCEPTYSKQLRELYEYVTLRPIDTVILLDYIRLAAPTVDMVNKYFNIGIHRKDGKWIAIQEM